MSDKAALAHPCASLHKAVPGQSAMRPRPWMAVGRTMQEQLSRNSQPIPTIRNAVNLVKKYGIHVVASLVVDKNTPHIEYL